MARVVAVLFTGLLMLGPFCGVGWAGGESEDGERPSLIQAIQSEAFGPLRVPGFWEVEEEGGRLQAVETRHAQPAALSLMMVDVGDAVEPAVWWRALVVEAQAAAPGLRVVSHEALPKRGDATLSYAVLAAEEGGFARRYGVLVVHGKARVLLVTLATVADRFASFAPQALLLEVLESMHD